MNRSLKIGLTLIALLLGVGGLVREAYESVRVAMLTSSQATLTDSNLQAKPQLSKPIQPWPQPSQPSRLAEAIEHDQPLRLRLPGRESLDFSFRDFPLFTEDYRTTLGQARRLEADLRVFEGRAVDALGQVHRASLALANRSLAGVVRMADGNTIELRGSEDGPVLALGQARAPAHLPTRAVQSYCHPPFGRLRRVSDWPTPTRHGALGQAHPPPGLQTREGLPPIGALGQAWFGSPR